MEWLLLALALALVTACGVFVAGEFALLAADRATVDAQAESGDRRARGVQRAFKTLSTQLSGVQLGITVTNLAVGFLAQPAIASLVDAPLQAVLGLSDGATSAVALAIALVLATTVTMLFGELVPKNIAISLPVETAKAVQGFVRGFATVMTWPIRFLNGSANAILHLFGLEATEELASARSPEELESLVRRSASEGTLDPATAALVQRSLGFGDKRAADVLTPRTTMSTMAATDSVADLIREATSTGHSRFPVVGESLDDVVGLVHVKRAVAVPEDQRATTEVAAVMAEAVLVPGSVDLDTLMDTLQASGLAMAVVVDEFGGTDGVVTIEDLIEELVGEVVDEHDRVGGAVRSRPGGAWSVPGLLRPDEVRAATGVALGESHAYETVAGLVLLEAGRIPARGDVVEVGDAATPADQQAAAEAGRPPLPRVRITVERMDGRRIDRVLLQPLDEGPGEDDAVGAGASRVAAERGAP